ncbi:MAG TPA: response regulator, partial [Gammaproteobacteria bacterium]|nr:response regulator [Gammaproteobacteria bacterium]
MHSTLHSNKLANILIVNDDQENTAVLRTLLTRSDYSVYFASRIEDALNTIEHRQVHLLILNIQLKTANAIELCKQVKTNT